jgi:hypothetical protein
VHWLEYSDSDDKCVHEGYITASEIIERYLKSLNEELVEFIGYIDDIEEYSEGSYFRKREM